MNNSGTKMKGIDKRNQRKTIKQEKTTRALKTKELLNAQEKGGDDRRRKEKERERKRKKAES